MNFSDQISGDNFFDLLDIKCTDEDREMRVRYMGEIFPIRLKKMRSDLPLGIWLVPGNDVLHVFKEKYADYLANFLGILLETCYSKKARLPLLSIDLSEIKQAAERGDSLGKLASEICVSKS
jgi:hypothetical protein